MAQASLKIALIGTGNVSWHLARALENAGHVISHVYGRKSKSAEAFVRDLYHATASNALDLTNVEADVFIMAVSDNAIETLSQELQLSEGSILAHTSGAVSLNKLGYAHTPNTGVFYPLQTFSKGKPLNFEQVPICIEGSDEETEQTLVQLAESISENVQLVNSRRRKSIHLAAVFACNFTNHMFSLSKEIMTTHELDWSILRPLIAETLNKSLEIGPENAQTGPAKRKDLETLDEQYQALKNDESVAELYRMISQHIIDYYSE